MASPTRGKSNGKPFSAVPGPEQPQHASKLMMLPAELRNRIYGLVLGDVVAYRARKTPSYRKVHRVKTPAPGLLLACKQTHNEAIQLFYAQSTFLFDDAKHINAWIGKIGMARAALVKSIRFSSPRPSHSTMAASFWEPRTAMWLYSMEASARLVAAQQGLPKSMKRSYKIQTDLYLPGSPEIEILWTQQPVTAMEGFLKGADEKVLALTHQAFLMLSNERNKVW